MTTLVRVTALPGLLLAAALGAGCASAGHNPEGRISRDSCNPPDVLVCRDRYPSRIGDRDGRPEDRQFCICEPGNL